MAVKRHKEAAEVDVIDVVDVEITTPLVGADRDLSPQPSTTPSRVTVRNIHTQYIALESGLIKPGEEGLSTLAELSCLLGHYVERVEDTTDV
jgi:hypothetical protein